MLFSAFCSRMNNEISYLFQNSGNGQIPSHAVIHVMVDGVQREISGAHSTVTNTIDSDTYIDLAPLETP